MAQLEHGYWMNKLEQKQAKKSYSKNFNYGQLGSPIGVFFVRNIDDQILRGTPITNQYTTDRAI